MTEPTDATAASATAASEPAGASAPSESVRSDAATEAAGDAATELVGDTASTGHPAVDALRAALANAAILPPSEQIAGYEAAHVVLQETLAAIDET